jgi:hypothetical protein
MNHHAFAWLLLLLLASRPGCAAEPMTFGTLGDSSSALWSGTPLNKGDVVEVHAFRAEPGAMVFLAICNDACDDAHVVKSISASRPTTSTVTERYTLEESGHLVFWTVRPPRPDFNPGASKAISDDSKNQVADAIHSGFSGIYNGAEVMRIVKSEIGIDQVKVRFDGGSFVTVRRVSTASETRPPGEHP